MKFLGLSTAHVCLFWAFVAPPLFITTTVVVHASTTLQILHSSDLESSFIDPNTLEEKILGYSAVVEGLRQYAQTQQVASLHVTAGDLTIPGPFYLASSELEVEEDAFNGSADMDILNALGNVANGIGNHEFDGGIDEFAAMLNRANFPFLSVNLDFSNTSIPIGTDGASCQSLAGQVAKSCTISIPSSSGNETVTIGLVGRAPNDFFNLVEDPTERLPGLDFFGGRGQDNLPLLSALPQVQAQVDLLTDTANATIIILLDHAQDYTDDPLSVGALSNVDIIVQAGGTGFLASEPTTPPFNTLREGDTPIADYPNQATDADGHTVLIINTDQQYLYLGHLWVTFDDMGLIESWNSDMSGPVPTTVQAVTTLSEEILSLNGTLVQPAVTVVETLEALKNTASIQNAFFPVAMTEFPLIGDRDQVRTRETNLARVVADSTLWGGNRYASENGLPPIQLALKNAGGIRDTIGGPTIVRLTIQAALAFDNRLALIELTGAQLLAAMENGVSRVPAADGRLPHVAGMILEYDPSQTGIDGATSLDSPSRVKTLMIMINETMMEALVQDFVVVGDLNQTYAMATNSFLLTGGDGYASFTEAIVLGETDIGEQQILEDYMVDFFNGTVNVMDPPGEPRVYATESPLETNVPTAAPVPTTTKGMPTITPGGAPDTTNTETPTEVPSGATPNMALMTSAAVLTVSGLALLV